VQASVVVAVQGLDVVLVVVLDVVLDVVVLPLVACRDSHSYNKPMYPIDASHSNPYSYCTTSDYQGHQQ